MVYQAAVIYQAPVVYQAPVIYNAPVFYMTRLYPTKVTWAEETYTCPTPNVIITGGSKAGAYYLSSETTPNVIIIRNGQSGCRVTPARRF